MPQFPSADAVEPVHVLHIPTDHAYVRHLSLPDGASVEASFIAVPDPAPPQPAGTWQPSPAFDPGYFAPSGHGSSSDDSQVVHLHFGYEHLTPTEVTGWADRVRGSGRRFVVTVHDLDNPHLVSQDRHRAGVAAAVAAADRVVTLTPGAAGAIERRWGRTATVVPHPHVLPLELVGTRESPRRTVRPRIGVPLGAVRANVCADRVLRLLAAQAGVQLEWRVLTSVMVGPPLPGPGVRSLQEELQRGADRGAWQLRTVGPGQPESAVWQWLSSLDALVLPYAWGSHSGWLEACADVGTSVIAPAVGFWHQQQPVIGVPAWARATAADVGQAVDRVRDRSDPVGGGLLPLSREARWAQRLEIHRAHGGLYRSALG